jgi:hypothetical protein
MTRLTLRLLGLVGVCYGLAAAPAWARVHTDLTFDLHLTAPPPTTDRIKPLTWQAGIE